MQIVYCNVTGKVILLQSFIPVYPMLKYKVGINLTRSNLIHKSF